MRGQGCCHGGACYCATSYGGISGVARLVLAWQSARADLQPAIISDPGLGHFLPPWRPPIV
jgi:hypothetical protein